MNKNKSSESINELATIDNLPFFKWQGKNVMTFPMIDKLHKKADKTSVKIFRRCKHEFVMGRDVYFISGKDVINGIPPHMPFRYAPELWLITESGYRILLRHFRDDLARKISQSLKQQSNSNCAAPPVEHENKWLAKHNLPFFEWRGKRVMTFAMIDKLHGLSRGISVTAFCKNRSRFVIDRDVYLISGAEAYDVLPTGIDFYCGPSLWLVTESGYLTLIRSMKNPFARKIRRSQQQSKLNNINAINSEVV